MSEIKREEWNQIETNTDACDRCKSEPLFDSETITPARPWNPVHHGRLLFISENPPITGGFWENKSDDGLRQNIIRLLKIPHNGNDHHAALESFLSHQNSIGLQFFLIQTLKWPYAKNLRQEKKGYNQYRHSTRMRRLIEHTVSAHLGVEIGTICPIGILAMGNAAWDACRELSKNKSDLPNGGIETVRGCPYTLQLASGSIALNVTHLPVGRNMNYPKRAREIRQDIEDFLSRHDRLKTG
jgi:uracil-DNA glycosylase